MTPETTARNKPAKARAENRQSQVAAMVPVAARLALPIKDAAMAIGCSRALLCQMLAKGVIPAKKLGAKRTVILRQDLEAYLAALPDFEPAKDSAHG